MYKFYGWESADCAPADDNIKKKIQNPRDLYDILLGCWSRETCAPRLRDRWTPDNPTTGQCSVTAFLAQDIFGGKVYGIPLPDGNFHCYNSAGGCVFDLTCEQFGDEAAAFSYADNPEQSREAHFAKREKYERYLLLKEKLAASINLPD